MGHTNGWIAIFSNSELIYLFRTQPVLREELKQPVQGGKNHY